ncbi:endogenous retrovirus group 3 member 1 Env polyprotein-like [Aphelocoma coerulescens]|uniref:endogenous retrovirus group 3 member 1 Env polyprotein-like n=1 Tax=Aphelocoma coerulescens TaxID=39617 RepID=UPI0036045C69
MGTITLIFDKANPKITMSFQKPEVTEEPSEGEMPKERTKEAKMTTPTSRGNPNADSSSRVCQKGKVSNILLLSVICLWVLWPPFTQAADSRCNRCYKTVYQAEGGSFQIRHFFRAHTYVNPSCYNITRLSICSEKGHKYWIGKNIGTQIHKQKGECPSQDDWLCFNFRYITKTEDLLKRKTYDTDLIQEVVIEEKEKQKENNPLMSRKNLFIDLAERIGQQLNLTNCWVCGGTLESESWPWRGVSLGPPDLLRLSNLSPTTRHDNETWLLSNTVIGEECIWRKGRKFLKEVGETICKRYLVTDGQKHWWIPQEPDVFWSAEKVKNKNCILNPVKKLWQCWDQGNPYSVLPQISKYWITAASIQPHFWEAPQDLYWICGNRAYSNLPPRWKGSCTLGAIQPNFFLLAENAGAHLGISLYDELFRTKRHVIGGTQRWGEEEWPPERILETYGPATWAQDGSWGYRTPIYMLNRIIRLQALIEVITNETSLALELLNTQQGQTRAAVYQNRLALDYLLAEEGGVCGKFNTSDCCIHIDDHGEAITKITQNIRKLAHVPVQKWQPLITSEWWENIFQGQWWKKALIIVGLSLTGLIFLPCLIPCFIRLITTVVQSMPLIQDLQGQQQRPPFAQKIMHINNSNNKKTRKERKIAQQVWDSFKELESIPEELSTST